MPIHLCESLGRFKLSDEGQRVGEDYSVARLKHTSLL
jgi:hypothetical protein